MAAATTAIVAVAGLGLTAYSMYDADQKGKEAQAAADQAKKDLMNVQEQNMYKGLQVADLNELEKQERARMNATATLGLQEAGAEAVLGGVPKLTEVDREAALKTAQEQAKRVEARDLLIAQEDAAIEARKKGVERGVYGNELQGAQVAMRDAEIAKAQGTQDLIGGVGMLAEGIGEATSLEAKANRAAKKAARNGGEGASVSGYTPRSTGTGNIYDGGDASDADLEELRRKILEGDGGTGWGDWNNG